MNIKNIGKELMGKSLNSYHRKTGLAQLEENNKMQDGILNGILSQVDDAYIEKTEQSNVIHLDGSGDGVVVLDSIEGNTMVNLVDYSKVMMYINFKPIIENNKITATYNHNQINFIVNDIQVKPNTTYTMFVQLDNALNFDDNTYLDKVEFYNNGVWSAGDVINLKSFGKNICCVKHTTNADTYWLKFVVHKWGGDFIERTVTIKDLMFLEGDWTNREIPPYFEGMQSSFEEKVNDEGKYEIEILMKNKNLFDTKNIYKDNYYIDKGYGVNATHMITYEFNVRPNCNYKYSNNEGKNIYISLYKDGVFSAGFAGNNFNTDECNMVRLSVFKSSSWHQLEEGSVKTSYTPHKSNKIKVLINEPLRAVGDAKDRLCVKDGKLVVERNCRQWILDGSENWVAFIINANNAQPNVAFAQINLTDNNKSYVMSNILTSTDDLWGNSKYLNETISVKYYWDTNRRLQLITPITNLQTQNLQGFKDYLNKRYAEGNPIKALYELAQPYYEEVTNEYGEPILLEGYENGTLYIDSTIVPTTTVRYTPKMASFNTLKEVSNSNVMLTNDINDTIIPYLMEVDLMIMEKEMVMMNQNTRAIGVKDMTSMQKRTQDMLERLIKGKTLTEQECKTRVTTYLNADKITDEQAEELMLLISEVYV